MIFCGNVGVKSKLRLPLREVLRRDDPLDLFLVFLKSAGAVPPGHQVRRHYYYFRYLLSLILLSLSLSLSIEV
jgi:hypothetical protein